ncbi:MAG: gliding motility-associated C-terminal domain-containing protein [Bacteroidota bacterium]
MKKIVFINLLALLLGAIQLNGQCSIQVVITETINETCTNSSDGTATAFGAGSGPINYVWSNGQNNATATGLTTGTYTVTATDDNGCTGTAEATIILDPEGVWIMTSTTPVTCNGGNDGTAYAGVMTGQPPYVYQWDDPAGSTVADPTGLAAGLYQVTVTDVNGCSNVATATVDEPTALVLISNSTNESCVGNADATASVTASGGTPGYTYLWSTGATTAFVTNMTAGNYEVTVTDANGCTSATHVTVNSAFPAIVINENSSAVTCSGDDDGTASVSPTGGLPPFTYSWSTGATTAAISNLSEGNYGVTITDDAGCTTSTTITIGTANPPIVISQSFTNVDCNGGSNGMASVTITSGNGPFTYAWSNAMTGNTINGLVAGNYTVTATGNGGCTSTTMVTITEPTALTVTGTGTNVTTAGGDDGTATASATGGTPTYTYAWSNGGNSSNITNLTAGVYTVTVTDANGCTSTTEVPVNGPLDPTVTSTPSTCGEPDGTATVTLAGGVAPYTYLWDDGQTTATATGLLPGTYSVTVTDAMGATTSTSVTVEETPSIVATASHSNETCVGSMDGHVAVSTTGGVGQMSFLWNTGDTTFQVNNLSVGTYTVTATDEVGCTATASATIELSPEGIWVDVFPSPVFCFGGSDGSANAVVTTGVAPYTHLWSNGDTTLNIANVPAGTYTITVTDVNGCEGIFTTDITEPTELTVTTSSTNTDCNVSIGTATVTVNGGTPSYTYLWSNNNETTQSISGLAAGVYTVTATDANGCTVVTTTEVEDNNTIVIATTSVTNVSSAGAADGEIDIEVSGGNSPYTYLWSNGATTQDITDLVVGCYTVTVTDALGCSATATECVDGPNLMVTVTTTPNGCMGDNMGTATAVATGGTPPYTYMWENATMFPLGDSTTIIGLTNGIYCVTVTDANGATATACGEVTGSGGVGSSATATNITCPGDNDGTATASGIGGAPGLLGYEYSWSTDPSADTTQTITGLSAGTYTVTVTDQTGCTSTSEVTVTEPSSIITTGTITTDPTTQGGNDGAIDLMVSGGTPGYTYLWSNGATTQDLTGLTAGCYTVTITDANDCTATAEHCIDDPLMPPPSVSLSIFSTPDSCTVAMDGTATVVVNTGTSPFTFEWQDNSGALMGNDSTITGIPEGTYTVIVTDANNFADTLSVDVDILSGPDADATATQVSCDATDDGTVNATATGGTAPYDFSWTDANGDMIDDSELSSLMIGTYTVVVTDLQGCKDTTSVEITQDDPVSLSENITQLDCNGDTDGSIAIIPNGGVAPYTYTWADASLNPDSLISNLGANDYAVTVTDANNCTATAAYTITEPLAVTLGVSDDDETCDETYVLNATVDAGISVNWYSELGGTSIGSGATLSAPLTNGENVFYAIADEGGCPEVDSVIIIQDAIDVTATGTVLCVDELGQLSATDNNGNVISYEWTPAIVFTAGTDTPTPTLNTSAAGTFEVYLTTESGAGCEQTDTITIEVQEQINNFFTETNCVPLSVDFSSSVPGDYIWNYGDSNEEIANNPTHVYNAAGTYMVMMILPPGAPNADCLPDTVMQEITVSDDPATADFTIDFEPCATDSVEVTFTDNSSSTFTISTWDWEISNGDTSDNQNFSTFIDASGSYTAELIIEVNGGCTDTLTQPFEVNILEVNLNDTTICVDTELALNPNANPNFEYEWSGGLGNDPNPIVTLNTPTTYDVTVTDPSVPCEVETSVTVDVHQVIDDLQTTPDTVVCEEQIIILQASSAMAMEYAWYDDPLLTNQVSNQDTLPIVTAFDIPIQYYYVEAIDSFGCVVMDSVLAGSGEIQFPTQIGEIDLCANTDSLITIDVESPNSDTLFYEWVDDEGMPIGFDDNILISPTQTGLYSVTVFNDLGCEETQDFQVSVSEVASVAEAIDAAAMPFDSIVLGEVVTLNVEPDEGHTYVWDNDNTFVNGTTRTDKNPDAAPLETTNYSVIVTETTTGCTAIANVLITVINECDEPFIFLPNAFSPNDDGENDQLFVRSIIADEIFLVIYNRWGEKVFETNDKDIGWDGTHNGEKVCSDVYGYYLRANCINGQEFIKKGNVTVLK